jgi:hypothetical protein
MLSYNANKQWYSQSVLSSRDNHLPSIYPNPNPESQTPAMHPSIPSAHTLYHTLTQHHRHLAYPTSSLAKIPKKTSPDRSPIYLQNVSSCRHPRVQGSTHPPGWMVRSGLLIRHPAHPSRDFPRPRSADSHLISLTSCSCGFFLVMTIPEYQYLTQLPYSLSFFCFEKKGEEELTCSLLSSIT